MKHFYDLAFRITLLLVTAVSLPLSAQADGLTLAGTVTHVRDGDTIEVNGIAVRLQGLHAPELDTPAGQEATAFMQALTLQKEIICQLTGEQSYDRQVGICWLDRRDIAVQLVSSGLGRDCPRYSRGRYAALETKAAKQMKLPRYCR